MGNVFIVITIVVEVTQIQRNALAQAAFEGKKPPSKPAPKSERDYYYVDGPNGPQMFYKEDKRGSHIIEKRGGRTDHWC